MDIENFARVHPMGYVHVAYSIVWGLHLAFAIWIAVSWNRTKAS